MHKQGEPPEEAAARAGGGGPGGERPDFEPGEQGLHQVMPSSSHASMVS